MKKNEIIKIAIIDSLLWLWLTSLIGFMQICLYYMLSVIMTDRIFELENWIINGTIIAFSLALVSSIYFDNHFQEKHYKLILRAANKDSNVNSDSRHKEYFGSLFYKLVPWFLILMVAITTLLSVFAEASSINKRLLIETQITGVVLAYIYTIYYKYCSFAMGLSKNV